MKQIRFHPLILTISIALIILVNFFASTSPVVLAQQPTATPAAGDGMYITVTTDEPQINVRMGPNVSIYPIVGKLPTGSTAPALGRSQGGDWIQIEYSGAPNNKGWVYSPLVEVSPGILKVVAPPPTPLPPPTSTIDPTLAAQFNIVPTNTRLPTFTPPPSLTVLSYTDAADASSRNSVPLATVIIALAILGSIGFLLSIFFRR
jgi:uncharacterized protein YgiM (DUF1202 family)